MPSATAAGICLSQSQLRLLCDVHGGNRVLTDGLLISIAQLGITLTHDLAHAQLGQFLRQRVLFVEQAAFKRCLVLQKARDDLIQVFFANAGGLRRLRLGEACNLQVNLARVLVHPDVVPTLLVTFVAIVEAFLGACVLRRELVTGCQNLLHQQAG
ncbi:hypothetical protein D3C72_1490440 [compost metagenome]